MAAGPASRAPLHVTSCGLLHSRVGRLDFGGGAAGNGGSWTTLQRVAAQSRRSERGYIRTRIVFAPRNMACSSLAPSTISSVPISCSAPSKSHSTAPPSSAASSAASSSSEASGVWNVSACPLAPPLVRSWLIVSAISCASLVLDRYLHLRGRAENRNAGGRAASSRDDDARPGFPSFKAPLSRRCAVRAVWPPPTATAAPWKSSAA